MTTTQLCTLYLFIPSTSSIISFHLFCFALFFSVSGKKLQCFSSINFLPFYQIANLKSRDILIFELSWNLIAVAFFKVHNRSFTTFATFSSFIGLKEINKFGFPELNLYDY